jgi:hypothetical protein
VSLIGQSLAMPSSSSSSLSELGADFASSCFFDLCCSVGLKHPVGPTGLVSGILQGSTGLVNHILESWYQDIFDAVQALFVLIQNVAPYEDGVTGEGARNSIVFDGFLMAQGYWVIDNVMYQESCIHGSSIVRRDL